jgi:signal transduction histidine kinase
MNLPRWLLPRSIAAQIAVLVTIAIFLGHMLTEGVMPLFFARSKLDEFLGHVATITQLARTAPSHEELSDLLAAANRSGIVVRQVELAQVAPPKPGAGVPLFDQLVSYRLERRLGLLPLRNPDLKIFTIRDPAALGGPKRAIVVPLDQISALAFDVPIDRPLSGLIGGATVAILIISLFIILASLYAVRWITSPLSYIACAARAFGRSPSVGAPLPERGPREIVQVAQAMNEMRERIRTLVADRTRMLAAISHDLRTPLTRLRLRAERLPDIDTQDSMLRDIARVNDMLGETLIYLREGALSEKRQRLDLPSLLQTVCAEFADMGHPVTYRGPQRFAFSCRRTALARAIANIVDNGIKNGPSVIVRLRVENGVDIDICDDGPGIDSAIRDKVFEPFFKGDSARASPLNGAAGFGLGLSIARDIVRDHDGEIELLDGTPKGLIVRIKMARQLHGAQ